MQERYGRWTLIAKITEKGKETRYVCVCDCGTQRIIPSSNLTTGKTKSCGCYRNELYRKTKRKYNEFDVNEETGVVTGLTTNTNKPFYVDIDDYEKIKNFSWYEGKNGYVVHREGKAKSTYLHRVIANPGKGLVVDHINHNKMDNRKANLRVCTYRENAFNRKVDPNGISETHQNGHIYYQVQLCGKHQGCFTKYEDAKALRDKLIEKYYRII